MLAIQELIIYVYIYINIISNAVHVAVYLYITYTTYMIPVFSHFSYPKLQFRPSSASHRLRLRFLGNLRLNLWDCGGVDEEEQGNDSDGETPNISVMYRHWIDVCTKLP